MGLGIFKITKTILTLGIIAGFVIGISFSSVYAGVLIDTDDIADDAITSEKIKNRQVKGTDVKGNALNSGKIRDGTIQLDDLSPELRVLLGLSVPTGAGLERFLEPTCNPGDVATGGGYSADSPSVLSYIQFRPNPQTQDSTPTSWITQVKRNPGFDNNPITFHAYVICNNRTP